MDDLTHVVQQAIAGDKQALSDICLLKGRSVIYLCAKSLGNLQDAEDAAQEVFIRVSRGITSLKEPQAFSSWLYRIAKNVCNNVRRNNMKDSGTVSIDAYGDTISARTRDDLLPQSIVEDDENKRQLLGIVDALPHNMRMCVLLFYYEGLSHADIASVLELAPNTVNSYLQRARVQIREEIQTRGLAAEKEEPTIGMAALGGFFLHQAQQWVPQQMVGACVGNALGATAAGTPRFLKKNAGKMALATAGVAALSALALLLAQNEPSPPPQSFVPGSGIPQYLEALPESAGEVVAGSSSGQASLLQPAPSAPASAAAEVQISLPAAPPENVVHGGPVSFSGQVVLLGGRGQSAEGGILHGQQVALLQGHTELARTAVQPDGSFAFENVPLPAAGSYTLWLDVPETMGIGFPPQCAYGRVELALQPGVVPQEPPVIYFLDERPPALSVVFYAGEEPSPVNPERCEIVTDDLTSVTLKWTIEEEGARAPCAGGSGAVPASAFAALPAGTYRLVVHASDLVGNETREMYTFYVL